jgi:hypothetical protein
VYVYKGGRRRCRNPFVFQTLGSVFELHTLDNGTKFRPGTFCLRWRNLLLHRSNTSVMCRTFFPHLPRNHSPCIDIHPRLHVDEAMAGIIGICTIFKGLEAFLTYSLWTMSSKGKDRHRNARGWPITDLLYAGLNTHSVLKERHEHLNMSPER